MSEKWPHFDILVVMPSRLEAGAACFDHFLNRTTRTGEPLGYQVWPASPPGTLNCLRLLTCLADFPPGPFAEGIPAALEPPRRCWAPEPRLA